MLEEQLIYLAGTMLVLDGVILAAWAVPHLTGVRIGYRWRKILWLMLAVCLLVPVRLIMSGIYEDKPPYFVQIDVPRIYGMGSNAEKADIRQVQAIKSPEVQGETGEADEYGTDDKDDTDSMKDIKDHEDIADQKIAQGVEDSFITDLTEPSVLPGGLPGGQWAFVMIWIFGALALIVFHLICYLKVREQIRKQSRHCTDQCLCGQVERICGEYRIRSVPRIFICSHIRSPMLFGYCHTRLLMPDRPYDETERGMIVRHELQHQKNRDLWYKLLMMLVCDLYWFNPILLLMRRLAYQDVECVCDSQVMRRLSVDDQKRYGNIVLDHMAETDEKGSGYIGYGTSIFTGKKAARLRIRNMFAKKNKWGYIIMGVLVLCAVAGSSMWMLSGHDTVLDGSEQNPASDESDRSPVQDSDQNSVSTGQDMGQMDQDRVVFTEDLNDLYRAKNLDCTNCYTTEITRGGNHYWIDGQGTLWGTGPSEYGQLKEVREDLTWIKEPVEIARNVKHVDFSGEYFVIFLTEDNQLYGLGGNPSGVLSMPTMEDYQFIITEPVLLMENVIYAKCGYYTVIALTQEGDIYMRGQMEYIPYYTAKQGPPVNLMENIKYASWPVEVLEHAKYVTSYDRTFAVIDNNNSLWTWGDNQFGQCGVGTFSDQIQTPQRVMDDVECVWIGQAAFNNTDETAVRSRENLIVLKKDGTFYGCGEGIGTKHLLSGINDLDEAQEVTASEKLVPVSVQEYVPPVLPDLKEVQLQWTEETLKQFLDEHDVDYTVGYTDEGNYPIYHANQDTWEFIFDHQGQLGVIGSTKCDEMCKGLLAEGDSLQKVTEVYGTDYRKHDLGWGYSQLRYEEEEYSFWIGIYDDWGCARFEKHMKGFDI